MRHTIATLAVAAALSVYASGSSQTSASAAAAPAPSSADFVAQAAASDMFEIQSSQIALQKSQAAPVRQFAQMMVDHHTMTTRDLTAAAQKAGLTPPSTLPPDKAQKIAALQSAPAAGFDAAYMREQVQGHQEALALHQSYAAGGDNADLKGVARKAVPIVTGHLRQAQELASR